MKHKTVVVPKEVPSRKYNSSKYVQFVAEFLDSNEASAEVIREECSPKAIRAGLKRAIEQYYPDRCKTVLRGESVFLIRGEAIE